MIKFFLQIRAVLAFLIITAFVVLTMLLIGIYFLFTWMFGVRFAVTRSGKSIGAIRWFKFIPK